jgi:diguanylate cyclase (GGDEF)-like protein
LYDDLTGLPNRRFLKDQISQLCQSDPEPATHALMLLDLDNFKDINDSFGHPTGDELLQQVAHRLQRFAQTGDYCARLGGDEFVLLLPHLGDNTTTASAHLMELAEKLRAQLAEPYRLNGNVVRTTASVGISLFVAGPDDSANALKQADIALYQSKASGRNCSTFFDPELQKAMDQRNQILRELKTALEHQELQLFYQPIFDAQQQITGVEALLRWHSPVLGFVSPAVFIPLAEESNLILDIGNWVLQTACQQIAQWQSHPVRQHWIVAVNVSARQLQRANFVDTVTALVRQSQIPAACLQLEVTESMLQHDIDDTMQALSILKAMGVRFSLDDFGTGYSSLNYLTKLPIHTLKIDRSFVDRMLQSHEDASVVQTILALAKGLGLEVVAEGVETVEQFRFLQQAGCQKFQGYLFARPVPAEALPEGTALPADTAAQLAKC